MKRKGKEFRRRGKREGEKVGDLNRAVGLVMELHMAIGRTVHFGSRRCNALLRERLLDLPSLEGLAGLAPESCICQIYGVLLLLFDSYWLAIYA